LQAGLLLTIAGVIVGILGYIFQIIAGRLLGPVDFALFSSLIAFFMILSAPLTSVGLIIISKASYLFANNLFQKGKHYYLILTAKAAFINLLLFGSVFLFSDLWIEVTKSQTQTQVLILVSILAVNIFVLINNSFFQGFQLFNNQAKLNIFSAAIKLISGILLISYGYGIGGGLLAILLSVVLVWIYGLVKILTFMSRNESKESKENVQYTAHQDIKFFHALIMNISIALMSQADIIVVNWVYDSKDAGTYAAASVLGKAVLYLSSGLVMALFPMTIESNLKSKKVSRILILALSVTFLICGFAAIFYSLTGHHLIHYIYGKSFEGAGIILKWYGISMLPMCLIIIFENFLLANTKILFSWLILLFTPFQFLIIYIFVPDIYYLPILSTLINTVVLIIGTTLFVRIYKKDFI
jgi:O-antigen/teichoic acid export membrane protein